MRVSVALNWLVILAVPWIGSMRARAEDLNPPEWRGEPNTAYAVWEFSEDVMPDEADIWVSPPSGAEADEMGGVWEIGDTVVYTEYRDSVEGRSGVRAFDLNEITMEPGGTYYITDMLGFRLDNYPSNNAEKQIRVQVVWRGAGPPYLAASAVGSSGGAASSLVDMDLGDGWTHSTYEMVLQPNPVEETVFLTGGSYSPEYLFVDQVVIDTHCVPEPGALPLLALGVIGLVAGKRRIGRANAA